MDKLWQRKIEAFLKERQIEYLIHFTDQRNLGSIKKLGLLPVKTLKKMGIKYYSNDKNRYDYQLEGISVSVTSRNRPLFDAFKMRYPGRDWVELKIDAHILALQHCLFFDCNAANAKYRQVAEEDLYSFDALVGMFAPSVTNKGTVRRHGKLSNITTDNQAEIIVKPFIPKTCIKGCEPING